MRVKKLQEKISQLGLDGIIIGSKANYSYLSGFTGSNATLIISLKEAPFIVTDFRYLEQVKNQCPQFIVVDQGKTGHLKTVITKIRELGLKKVGFEADHVSYKDYKSLTKEGSDIEWVETQQIIETMRQVKDKSELEKLAKAESIGDLAFQKIIPFIETHWKTGLTENEIAFEIESIMRQNGASGLSFDTIVATGAKSALPHAEPSDDVIKKGDLVVMDFGCVYEGYCSDMTRTIAIGEVSEKQKEIYKIVLEAQKCALKDMKPGMTGQEIDALARDYIQSAGYGDYFGHSLGHSVGLEIHEEPRCSATSKTKIEPKMVVTVEPGIYIPNLGGVRIEDMVVMTETGIRNLTHSPKELIIIQ